MKYLLFGIFFLFSNLSCGQDIVTVDGNIPIILSAPHGGSIESNKIKNRTFGVTTKDSYTIEVLKLISQEIQYKIRKQPSIIYANNSRKEIDYNREVDSAFVDKKLSKLYYQYHHDIQKAIMNNIWSDSVILYVDIHGQNHKHGMLEIGFDKEKGFTEKEILLGNLIYSEKILCYPSSFTEKPKPYFNGGYCIEIYKRYPNVIAVQLEIPNKMRNTLKKRKEFAKIVANVLVTYYAQLQKEKE